jgi:hypothetical protein
MVRYKQAFFWCQEHRAQLLTMPHHFLCLQPLVNQGYIGNICATRSLQAALGSPRHFYPAFYHLLVAYTPVCSDKMLRLERLAAQDAHHLTAHVGVARRCHTRPQNSPTCRVQCSPKFGAFLVHAVGAAIGLVRGTPPFKTLPTIIELPYVLPPDVLPRWRLLKAVSSGLLPAMAEDILNS